MNNYNNSLLSKFTLLLDTTLGVAVYVAFISYYEQWDNPVAKASIAIMGLIYLSIVFSGGILMYKRDSRGCQIPLLVLKNCIKLSIFSSLIMYICHITVLPVMQMTTCFELIFIISSLFRLSIYYMARAYRQEESHATKVVLMGSSSNNMELYSQMAHTPAMGYRVLGYFDYKPNENFPKECEYLGTPQEVEGYLKENKEVKGVYCSLKSQYKDDILPVIHYCVNNLVNFYNVPSIRNYLHNRMYMSFVGTMPVLGMYESPLTNNTNRIVKRIFDIMISLTFLCTLFPFILLMVTVITKITMPGPVFFRQKRNGLDGKTFYCIKFRSMKVNADADKVQATKNDPRKTKWGNIMRKTSIDELPQFINVLLGDMSVVGPRPHMQKHTDEYSKLIDKYMIRHLIKPGITGWSQVTGFRGETKELWQMEGRVKGDLWYMEHWSLGLDLFIIYKTVANALGGEEEAY